MRGKALNSEKALAFPSVRSTIDRKSKYKKARDRGLFLLMGSRRLNINP